MAKWLSLLSQFYTNNLNTYIHVYEAVLVIQQFPDNCASRRTYYVRARESSDAEGPSKRNTLLYIIKRLY